MLWIVIGLFCLAIDRLSKLYVANNLMTGQSIPVIDNVFHITYHLNDGAAFSVFGGRRLFLIVSSVLIMLAILYYIIAKKPKNNLLMLSLTFILAGAAGNLFDRLFNNGNVIDFFDLRLINFPVFNVADFFVSTGAVLLFVCILKFGEKVNLK
jgi:signal peptidase II